MRWLLALLIALAACGGQEPHCDSQGGGWLKCYDGAIPYSGKPPRLIECVTWSTDVHADGTMWLCSPVG